MKRIILACILLGAAAVSVFGQGMTTDDWYRLNRVSDVQFAPDGKTILYVPGQRQRLFVSQ